MYNFCSKHEGIYMNTVSNTSETISPSPQYANMKMSPQNGMREIAASAFSRQLADRSLHRVCAKLLYSGNVDQSLTIAMQMSDNCKYSFYKEALNTCAYLMDQNQQSTTFQKILEAFAKINLTEALYFCTKAPINSDTLIHHLLSPSIQNGEMDVVFANYHRIKGQEMRKIIINEIVDKLIALNGIEEAFPSINRHFFWKQKQYFYINFMECLIAKKQPNAVHKIIETVTFDPDTQEIAKRMFLNPSLLSSFSASFDAFEAKMILQTLFGPEVHRQMIWKLYTQVRFEFLKESGAPMKNQELLTLAEICIQNGDLLKSLEIAHASAKPEKLIELICKSLISKGLIDEAMQCIFNQPDSVDISSLCILVPVKDMINFFIKKKDWESMAFQIGNLPSRQTLSLAAECFAEKKVKEKEVFAFGDNYIKIESDRAHFNMAFLRYGSEK